MVRESHLRKEQLVLPLFVTEGTQKRVPVPSMPGVFQLSIDELLAETRSAWETGVRAILLFGIPDHKDEKAPRPMIWRGSPSGPSVRCGRSFLI